MSGSRRDALLGRMQSGSIGLYLACLAASAVPSVARVSARLRDATGVDAVEAAGLVCFCLFAAATLLLGDGDRKET